MRTLELFAGTQSFSKAVKHVFPDAINITVDISPLYNPTHLTNMLNWDYTMYPQDYFDIIWARHLHHVHIIQ